PATKARRRSRPPRAKKGASSARDPKARVTSRKLAISFDATLADDVQRAAERETGGNVSAWMAEAARAQLRLRALDTALAAYEAEHGEITEAELAEVDKVWPAD